MSPRGITRGGEEILPRSASWATQPAGDGTGRLVVPPSPVPMWPEYGRLLGLVNWYQASGYELLEHRGPAMERGNEIITDRRMTLLGPVPTPAEFAARWVLPPGTTYEAVPALGHDGDGLRVRDGLEAGGSRYAVDLRFARPGTETVATDTADPVMRRPIPLRDALRDPADPQGGWGRLPALVAQLRGAGARVHSAFGRYRRLSGLVEHSAGARVSGHHVWSELLATAALPAGVLVEDFGDGHGIVRDFPQPFRAERPRFALVLEP
ncbi:hypothetical protein [Curtobacterium sp. MCBD17_019]|uniref:hypothetical protein n=1 Tax=Curtobacterium sp. MCBD17_019 TaxID=2175669 RepID=UPI000DA97036|nr:hypothetical protein [Curtobacterium sp. MCBD17_019]PZE72073.1 hypothetical protein DEI82_14850 [Curtobacterium sp. MCBD17_019]